MPDSANTDQSNAIVIPPFLYAGFFILGLVLDYFFARPLLPDLVQYVVGGVMAAAALALIVAVVPRFRRAETTFSVHGSSSAIVTGGPYRFSRNPAYLSLTLLYLGLAVLLDSVWVAVLVIPVLIIMNIGVISREERYLEGKFGEEYLSYKRSVRRWI